MRKTLIALVAVVGMGLAMVPEAQAVSGRNIARRSARSAGSNTSGFPNKGVALSSSTIKVGRPGWYFPNFNSVDINSLLHKDHTAQK